MKAKLGVTEIQYDYGDNLDITTFEVGMILEKKYNLFSDFYKAHKEEIDNEIATELANQLSNSIQFGAPIGNEIILGETGRLFSIFLENREIEAMGVPGVPTLAALDGVNSRLKRYSGPRRPSFIDGGLLMSSFLAWIDVND